MTKIPDQLSEVVKAHIAYLESVKNNAISQLCEGVNCAVKRAQISSLFDNLDQKHLAQPDFFINFQAKVDAIKALPDWPIEQFDPENPTQPLP